MISFAPGGSSDAHDILGMRSACVDHNLLSAQMPNSRQKIGGGGGGGGRGGGREGGRERERHMHICLIALAESSSETFMVCCVLFWEDVTS